MSLAQKVEPKKRLDVPILRGQTKYTLPYLEQ